MVTGFWLKNVIWLMLSMVFISQFRMPTLQSNQTVNEFDFVVYSDNPFYGMNIDNNRGEIRFRISVEHKYRVLFFDILSNGIYHTVAAYNEKGIFISIQDLLNQERTHNLTNSEFEEVFGDILYNQSLIPDIGKNDIKNFSDTFNNKIILFGDINKNAYYIETLDNNSRLIEKSHPYLIAKPFVRLNQENPITSVIENAESDYQRLSESLEERHTNFSVMNGFNALGAASIISNQVTSIVLEPNKNMIYIAFDKDYEKLWMINLDGLTIETYSGFDKYHKGNVPKIGITSNDLRILNFSNEGLMKGVVLGAISIFIILLIPEIFALISFLRKRS